MPLWDGCQLIIKPCSGKTGEKTATLNSPQLILGGVREKLHIFPRFQDEINVTERKAHCAAARWGGGGGGQREEERGSRGWNDWECKTKKGEARGRGNAEEGVKMGMHANFIILLINFSSSNPPAGTWEQIGDGERLRKSRLILNRTPCSLLF